MSKLLGKLLCKELGVGGGDVGSCFIKYIKSSDCFEFKWKLGIFKMKRELVSLVAEMTNNFNWMYQWSVGYKTMFYLSDVGLLRRRELNYLASRLCKDFVFHSGGWLDDYSGKKELFMSGWLDNDTDFDNLCMIQYLFCLSPNVLDSACIMWKKKKWGRSSSRWLELKPRNLNLGRKPGSKNVEGGSGVVEGSGRFVETEKEFFERTSHNKQVALRRGVISWYLETCLEECKRRGEPFSREKYVEEWNELRKSY